MRRRERWSAAAARTRLALAMCALQLCSRTAVGTGVGERLSYGRLHELRTYPPHLPVQRLALLLSGDGGWGSPLDAIASRLSEKGTLVAGIDVRDLFSSYACDPHDVAPCSTLT